MKPHKAIAFFTVALLWAVVSPAVAQEALTVDCPQVTGKCTFSLYLSRVTCSPQWTALELRSYDSPGNVVQISPGSFLKGLSTEKEYLLLRAEGIVPGEKKIVPETGMLPFTLYFEPLDTADDCFDFMGSEADDALQLRGIVLRPAEPAGRIHCHIEGSLKGEKRTTLLLLQEYGADPRIRMPVQIPVEDGHFSYDLYSNAEMAYELTDWPTAYAGGFAYPFFAEAGTVRISLDLSAFETTRIDGGALNRDFAQLYYYRPDYLHRLETLRDSLMERGAYLSPEATEIMKAMRTTDNDSLLRALAERGRKLQEAGKELTPIGRETEGRYRRFMEESDSAQTAYAQQAGTLPGYFFLLQDIKRLHNRQAAQIPDTLLQLARHYEGLYPHHPYTTKARTLIASLVMDRPGSRALEFAAADLDGTPCAFSDLRQGKIVFLDLWASWCGPCRRHSKEMIPVYEAYKDKGFGVVAVARERGNTQAMQAAMAADGYPWPSLVDLDDRYGVWERLGAGNAGGKTWLIDRDGTILLVNPTAEEVRKVLADKLK